LLLLLVPLNAEASEAPTLPGAAIPLWEKVAPDLERSLSDVGAEATVEFVLRLAERADLDEVEFQRQEVVQRLRTAAASSQARLAPLLDEVGFEIKASFWIANALLVEGPAGQVPVLTLSPLVARLHSNFEVALVGDESASWDAVAAASLTWGLERVGADQVWSALGVRGAGVRVCVSDTGVDVDHPDLAGKMWSNVPGDPQYPGGWIEFSSSGNPVGGSTPHDTHGHGTHTSGTVLGGDTSGTAIGIAPEATLMHALVLPGGGGSFAQVIAGIEWCVSPYDANGNPAGQAADVHSMSWGASGFVDELVDPIRNSYFAGTIPVAAAGNCGEGCTNSPGNIYDTLGIGASDENDLIASFSGGEVVSKASWSSPPGDWPDAWVVPLLSAPGVDVYSSLPGGSYGSWSGTSMATPHVAGCAALMVASNPDLTPSDIRLALVETVVWFDTYAPTPPDTRYGWGRLDCYAATESVAFNGGIRGSVRDLEDGAPVPEAQLNASGVGVQRQVETDEAGGFRISLQPGIYNLTVSRFGYVPQTVTDLAIAPESWVDLEFLLVPLPRSNITGTAFSSASGIGIPGVLVEITGVPVTMQATTGGTGAFVLAKVPEGAYDLLATSPYFQNATLAGVPVVSGTDSIVSFSMDPLPGVQVVDSQLEVTPQTGLWSETFQATIQAKNVDGASADYTATLYVNSGLEGVQTVTLASGELRSLTFDITRDPVGSYTVTLGPHMNSFRVRPPLVDVQVRALGGQVLPGASVTVGRGAAVLDMGETDGNGRVTFDSPGGSHGQYWIVVEAQDVPPEGIHYFLSRDLLVEDDLAVAFDPTENGTARFEMSMETVVEGQGGTVHLRRSEMPVAFSQAYAFPVGSLVVDPASYSLWSEVSWTSPGSSWTYEAANVTRNVTSSPSAQYEFGGRLKAWVAWNQSAENATADWNVSDAYGNDLLGVVQARAGILGAGETTLHVPFLSFWNAEGAVLASGYVAWSQKPARATMPANETVALVQVDLESGGYPFDNTFALDLLVLDAEGTELSRVAATRTTTVQVVGTVLLSGTPLPVNLTVNGEGVAVQPNGSFSHVTNLTRGLNTLVIHAVDPAGNAREEVYVIESKPDVALVVVPLPTYVNQTNVEVSGMVELDADLTINGVAVQPAEDGSFRVIWDLVEGPNTIVVAAEDFVGNRREVRYEVVRDTLPPDIAILAPVSGYSTQDATVSLIGSTEPNATLSINGITVPLEEGNFVFEVDLEAGDNSFLLEARDPAGNVKQTVVRVYRKPAFLGVPLGYLAYLIPVILVAAIGLAYRGHRRRLRQQRAFYMARARQDVPESQREEEVPWLHR
jgi:subtilisin family serine protease/uncharacterized protein YfaP (DUF2135 family)